MSGPIAVPFRRMPSVTACIVAYDEGPARIDAAITSLLDQDPAPDEIVICDNHPDSTLAGRLREVGVPVRVIPSETNVGFGEGLNLAARQAESDYLFFLNPDALAEAGCIEQLLTALEANGDAAIAGAQILLPDGHTTNGGDNPIHISGLSWVGRYGLPRETGPPRPTLSVSGGACLVRRSVWTELGGFTDGFFMYHDDVDLCWRARLAGHVVLFCPEAAVRHEYAFSKGGYKWRWMERNRLWCLASNMEARTLILLSPLLAVTELAIWAFALRGGWPKEKLSGYTDLWASRAALGAHRRAVQSTRAVGDAEILPAFAAELRTPLLPIPGKAMIGVILRAYRRFVVSALRRSHRADAGRVD